MPPAFTLDFGTEVNPTGFVFLHTLGRTEHLAVTVFVDRNGCKDGDILLFAVPVAAQIDAVHINIRIAATLQRAVALVACCLCQFLGILFQQPVRSFFDAAAHQLFQLPLANFLIELYNFLRHNLLALFRMFWCLNLILPEPAGHVLLFFNFAQLIILYQYLSYMYKF